jgi:hypothetical protein
MNRLYTEDFFGWTQDQADALRRRSANEIDWDHLQEELEALGQSQEDQLTSRLIVLIAHLLKWRLQPTKRTRSWVLTVREQRRRIDRLIRRNPSLKSRVTAIYEDAYPSAVDSAADETGLPESAFSREPPFDFDAAMSEPIDWDQS